MYTPAKFQQRASEQIIGLINAYPLGTWVTQINGELVINHIPFLFEEGSGDKGTLYGHVVKQNPVFDAAVENVDSTVVFQGENAYVSPSWYKSKEKHGRAVPTWSYVVVHVKGQAKFHDDAKWLRQHIEALSNRFESTQDHPWKVADAPKDFIDKALQIIIGVEIPIHQIEAKWKLNQHHTEEDKLSAIDGLNKSADYQSRLIAARMAAMLEENSRI